LKKLQYQTKLSNNPSSCIPIIIHLFRSENCKSDKKIRSFVPWIPGVHDLLFDIL